jgi:hypothetical protein
MNPHHLSEHVQLVLYQQELSASARHEQKYENSHIRNDSRQIKLLMIYLMMMSASQTIQCWMKDE